MQTTKPAIRMLESKNISEIVAAFQQQGWNKPAFLYERYLREQEQKLRNIYVAFVQEEFAGYLTICWHSDYEPFLKRNIPEIVDFNVLIKFHRQGIGTQLMDKAEDEIAKVSSVVGIGVGMTAGYGAAQRLYVLRGYVPDGRGLYYHDHPIAYEEEIIVDDDLVLYFTKELK